MEIAGNLAAYRPDGIFCVKEQMEKVYSGSGRYFAGNIVDFVCTYLAAGMLYFPFSGRLEN